MLQIGSLKLENRLVMAPLAGYTNLAFRLMVKELGAGLVTTEMVSSMGLAMGHKKTMDYLRTHPKEKPLSVQVFGSRPDIMARAAQMAVEAGADLIDINMGCPVKKVVKTGSGASLLRDHKKAAEIVTAVRLSCAVPLTVKIRAGWSPAEPVACDMARMIEDCGADAVTVHARFATDGFSLPADWSWIGKVKEGVKIPVIGNGDVFEPIHALQMRDQTGCDGIMVGRGALGNPWIFRHILDLEKGQPMSLPGLADRRAMVLDHFHLLSDMAGEFRAAVATRGLLLWYTKGLPHSARFRESISRIRDMASLVGAMDSYFSTIEESNP